MRLAYLTFALTFATAACATEGTVAPSTSSAPTARLGVSAQNTQVPLLYVVDGVRLLRDQVPALTADQVLTVSVMKGHLALQKFGPDAAYRVVVITTRAGNVPQT